MCLSVCQVMETKDAAVRDELYEEAQLLRRRQQDYKSELVGLPGGAARRKQGASHQPAGGCSFLVALAAGLSWLNNSCCNMCGVLLALSVRCAPNEWVGG